MSDEYSDWVPRNILYFSSFVEDLFNTKTKDEAFEMITRASPFLRSLEGARLQGGPKETTFNNLIIVEDVTKPSEIDLENPEDEKLRALSEGLLNGD
jgi:hypothetical protein